MSILIMFIFAPVFSQDSTKKVFYYFIDDNIAKPALRKTEKAIEAAQKQKADYLFLELNTFGGELDAADKIRTLLLKAPMPTIVFINHNAASAGALISIACDTIFMAPGASIGAASVVDQTGAVLPDKYQSYMRSLMRATAEMNGRDPQIAQAMVDPDIYVKNVSDSGKVLTFTTQEAIQYGFCEGEASSKEIVLKTMYHDDYILVEQEITWLDKVIAFLINPAVSGLLIMCIIGGIYFEFQSPGIGFPIIVAITAALLYFAPHYLEGLAAHWEILLFIVGLGLLMVELFVIPGFGIAGISGIILMVGALVLTMIFNIGFDFQYTPRGSIVGNLFLVLSASILGFFLSLWLGKKLLIADTRYGSLSLKTVLDTEKGFIAQDMTLSQKVGSEGIAITFMRPVGKIEIQGEIFDATSEIGLIDKGEKVKVTKFENAQLFVQKM
ncbi:MAG: NfeD family protein [Bacteroidales bacterium]